MSVQEKTQLSSTQKDFLEKHCDFSISGNDTEEIVSYNRELIIKTADATEQLLSTTDGTTNHFLINENVSKKNTMNEKKTKVLNLKKLPKLDVNQALTNSFYVDLQEYEGVVISISKDEKTFRAKLQNKKTKDILLGTFDTDEISSGDKELFKIGAIFIWKLGKEQNNGTQQNISQINFRRLPSFKKASLEKIEQSARERADAFRRLTNETTSSSE